MRFTSKSARVSSTVAIIALMLAGCAAKKEEAKEVQLTPAQYAAEWEKSNKDGLDAMSNKDYDKAESCLLKSLKNAEGCSMTDERVAVSLNNLASVYEEKKMYDECLPYLHRSKVIFQHYLPAGNKVLPVVLANEARVLSELKKYDQAEAAYVEAIAVQRKSKSNELPETLRGYSKVLTELNKTKEAKAAEDEANSLGDKTKS